MWYSQYRITNAVPDMTKAARATNSQSRFESSFISLLGLLSSALFNLRPADAVAPFRRRSFVNRSLRGSNASSMVHRLAGLGLTDKCWD
jgi:hypothetical protein